MTDRQVGVHVSIAGSLAYAFDRARERGCDCLQIFTKNPRGWNAKPITNQEAEAFIHAAQEFTPGTVFAHISYLPNLASDKPSVYERSVEALCIELERCYTLNIPYLVTHLGHAGDSPQKGRARVVDAIDTALATSNAGTMLLLENTAGEQNSVGSTLEDLADVFGRCQQHERIGVCFDTCHAFAAGYDLRTEESVGEVVDLIHDEIRLSSVHLIHLNDAKGDLASKLDRHEHIGLGAIGVEGMRSVLLHPGLCAVPCICETPVDDRRGDADNVRFVRELMKKQK